MSDKQPNQAPFTEDTAPDTKGPQTDPGDKGTEESTPTNTNDSLGIGGEPGAPLEREPNDDEAGSGSDPAPDPPGGGEPAGTATDVTADDVAQKRGFNGDAAAPAGNPRTDPLGTEGEPEQPAGSTHNESDPESKMTTDPEPRDPDAPLPQHSAGIDAPDADAPSDEPTNPGPSRDDSAAGTHGLP
ncbi:hypothetical protein SAMN04489806_1271 [Paramicrobacterium humi]|uniref:Uncharacterized protein n=1 Tax=Paramicrobacterium humi TaxID=640635 RepID=A0A1H4KQR4_9MICO|nr:hypothetical protein [Microbacterium humi]SEB60874.1 hypothetical protein SAMN04489806_1271 [Microbacterium humi]